MKLIYNKFYGMSNLSTYIEFVLVSATCKKLFHTQNEITISCTINAKLWTFAKLNYFFLGILYQVSSLYVFCDFNLFENILYYENYLHIIH